MVSVRIVGADVVAQRYEGRQRAFVAWADELCQLAVDEMQSLAGKDGYSKGTIPLAAEEEYFDRHHVGMYGGGKPDPPQEDKIINPQNARGVTRAGRPRPGGTTWLEGFRHEIISGGGQGNSIGRLHNDAWSTPYGLKTDMTLVKAFREGWGTPPGKHMRPRPIAAAIIAELPDRMRPHYRRMLGSYLRMEMP